MTTIKNHPSRTLRHSIQEYEACCSCGWTDRPWVQELKWARERVLRHRREQRPPWYGPLGKIGSIIGGHRDGSREEFIEALIERLPRVPYEDLIDGTIYVDKRIKATPHNNHRGRSTLQWLSRWQERIMKGLQLHQLAVDS